MPNLTNAQFEVVNGYRTQAEAVREARTALWGDVSFAKRAYLPGDENTAVTALVNRRLVIIEFDAYGRVNYGRYGVKVVA